jgi:hypothetical protein
MEIGKVLELRVRLRFSSFDSHAALQEGFQKPHTHTLYKRDPETSHTHYRRDPVTSHTHITGEIS